MEPAIASGHKTRRTRPTDLNRLKYKINHNDILNQLNRNKFILNKLTSSIRRDKKTNKQKKQNKLLFMNFPKTIMVNLVTNI